MDSEEKETKKQLVLKNKRALLEIIKEKPRKWNEIVKEAEEKYKISKDSVNKYLDEFKEIGIIKKDNDGRWWYVEHEVAVEDKDYERVMNHSLLTLPAFVDISREYGGFLAMEKIEYVKLLNVSVFVSSYNYSHVLYSKGIIIDHAEEHLKTGYPEAWTIVSKALTSVKELKKLEEEAKTPITENLEKKIKEKNIQIPETFGFPHLENYVHAIADYIWNLEIQNEKLDWEFHNDEKGNTWLGRFLFSKKGYEELIKEEICKVLPEVKEKVKKYKEVEKNLSKEREEADKKLVEIIYKVFSGEPLKGKCKGCPRVCLYYQPSKEQNEENNQQKSQVSQ
jgi:hypothetical protein